MDWLASRSPRGESMEWGTVSRLGTRAARAKPARIDSRDRDLDPAFLAQLADQLAAIFVREGVANDLDALLEFGRRARLALRDSDEVQAEFRFHRVADFPHLEREGGLAEGLVHRSTLARQPAEIAALRSVRRLRVLPGRSGEVDPPGDNLGTQGDRK